MLKDSVIEYLERIKDQKIKVVWNTGGDETIINFYQGDKSVRNFQDPLWEDLRDYFIQEFNLPNAGEYYNEGGGEISIVEDNKVLFVYDEFAYGDDYEAESDDPEEMEAFSIPTNLATQDLLEKLNITRIAFNGSTTFLAEEKDEFDIYSQALDYRKSKEKINPIQAHIKKHILKKLTPPFESMGIGYSGVIKEKEIIVEEVYKIKYFIDKNKKQEKVFLFEKGGSSWLESVFGKN